MASSITAGLVGTLMYSSLRSHNICNTPCLGIIYGEYCTTLSVARFNQIMPTHTLPQSITLFTVHKLALYLHISQSARRRVPKQALQTVTHGI